MAFEIEPILDIVQQKEAELTRGLREIFDDGMPYGQKRPTDEEIVQFVANMLEEYPFQWWIDEETGEYVFDSAWLAVLRDYNDRTDKDHHIEGAKETYSRIEKALQSLGGE